jgi:hypothetical protein
VFHVQTQAHAPTPKISIDLQILHVIACKLRRGRRSNSLLDKRQHKPGGNMKILNLMILTIMMLLVGQVSSAQDYNHHPKHNMILFGDSDAFYVSHLVYKEPHNYQVILKLKLNSGDRELIKKNRTAHPRENFIFLLDPMDISQIQSKPKISGQVFWRSSDESKHPVLDKLELEPQNYSVIYFDKLPLDLSAEKTVPNQ